jgi:hypothetical protein
VIHVVTTAIGFFTVPVALAKVGYDLRDRFRVWTYADLERHAGPGSRRRPPAGVWVFADLERLTAAQTRRAARIADRMVVRPRRYRLLNRPGVTATRLALLTRLHAAGVNDFRAWRVDADPPGDVTFPVFVRQANDHRGSATPLLRDPAALAAAVAEVRAAALPDDEWIAVEWRGWRRADGTYRKRSAFLVGDRVLPRHVFGGRHWVVKYGRDQSPDCLAEEDAYLASNEHADVVRATARLGGLTWGRIDFDVRPDGGVRVWEFNTNPTLLPWQVPDTPQRRRLDPAMARLALEALVAEDHAHGRDRGARGGHPLQDEYLRATHLSLPEFTADAVRREAWARRRVALDRHIRKGRPLRVAAPAR